MKTTFILLFSLFSIFSTSQVYQLKENIVAPKKNGTNGVRSMSSLSSADGIESIALNRYQYFEKIGEFGDAVYLKAYSKSDTWETIILSRSVVKDKFAETNGRWTFGVMSLPVKVRFGGGSEERNNKRYFDFEGGFNIGLSIGYRLNKNVTPEVKVYVVGSIGTSQVGVSPATTNGKATSEQDNSAFSPTAGFVFQFKNDLQLITIIGFDYLSGEVGANWVYKDKPFLGIGIGFSVFKFGEKEPKL